MPCIICGSNQSSKLYDSLLKCCACGFVWADLGLNEEQLKGVYSDGFFFGEQYRDYICEEKALKKNFRKYLKILTRFFPSGRLLEIGCAHGFFLDLARQYYEAEGIDVNENACKYAKEKLKLNVSCGDFLEMKFRENYCDIVAMWATLEHLRDPHLFVAKAASLLKKGGIFVCTVPDIGSVLARIQKNKWRQINLPAHLSFFSKNTLGSLLTNNNLQPLLTLRLGEYRTVDSALYMLLVVRNVSPRLYSLIGKLRLNRGLFYLNTYDTLFMLAVKR